MQVALLFFLILTLYTFLYNLALLLPLKRSGIQVEKFYIWYDAFFKLFSFNVGDTEYGLGWLPLGGYLKVAGMIMEEGESPYPHHFQYLSLAKQFFFSLCGPISGLLIAIATLLYIQDASDAQSWLVLGGPVGFILVYSLIFNYLAPIMCGLNYGVVAQKILYASLVLGHLLLLFGVALLINSAFPIFNHVHDVFIEHDRVRLFQQSINDVGMPNLVFWLGLFMFFHNVSPFPGMVGGVLISTTYRSLSGQLPQREYEEKGAMLFFVWSLVLYGGVFYYVLI
ncbi:site-2 protease family protein [Neolewinella agarilytica]|uniref:Peptidase family M50 n=1 Tax=Neolewinella agarilytica TaxID=478744 RepID=A0A1H9HED6_9BACT|nr:site-2 protease family protein [Neolewinella agarilytica]SEQ60700.1 Peptidase family M50 [Neolewinella agarilytica]